MFALKLLPSISAKSNLFYLFFLLDFKKIIQNSSLFKLDFNFDSKLFQHDLFTLRAPQGLGQLFNMLIYVHICTPSFDSSIPEFHKLNNQSISPSLLLSLSLNYQSNLIFIGLLKYFSFIFLFILIILVYFTSGEEFNVYPCRSIKRSKSV